MDSKPDLLIVVHTGDRLFSGTNNKVRIKLYDDEGKSSKPITLNKFFSNDMQKDSVDTYQVNTSDVENFDWAVKVERVEVWTCRFLGIFSDDWFVHKIVVENTGTNTSFVFPFFRWVVAGHHFNVMHLDTSLPHQDRFGPQRYRELERKKKDYQFTQKLTNGPALWDIAKTQLTMTTAAKIEAIFSGEFETIEDIKQTFNNDLFPRPRYIDCWNLDTNFGRQRIAGPNPTMVQVLKQVPDKFPVTDELLSDLLDGLTIEQAIQQKRLFITDHHMMHGMPTKAGMVICKPIGLFFINDSKDFLPVAIQLFQTPEEDNPIFTPKDHPMTWTYVKMWYNNADGGLHQSVAHLCYTHLVMEGFCIATHRNLSPSHPVFKLLAPHFLYLLNINTSGLPVLLDEGAWVDRVMNVGSKGMTHLIQKGLADWRLDVHWLVPEEMKSRGFDDPNVLPGYFYRDDSMMLYECIRQYVQEYIGLYYTSSQELKDDPEIQAWAAQLVAERNHNKGGCGFKGIPGNGELTVVEDLVKILTAIITTCSVTHAAVNFPQYDEYAFTPNFPGYMKGKPPTSKDAVITEKEIMSSLADQTRMLDIIIMFSILSSKGTKQLGDFEVQYVHDPKALQVIAKFRERIEETSQKIKERNSCVFQPYYYLNPDNIPNAISI